VVAPSASSIERPEILSENRIGDGRAHSVLTGLSGNRAASEEPGCPASAHGVLGDEWAIAEYGAGLERRAGSEWR
jgi:hypothetical protein